MPQFKHSGDIGDLFYTLPAIRYLGGGDLFLNSNSFQRLRGVRGLTDENIQQLIPVLEIQEYVNKAVFWKGEEVEIDLDAYRKRRAFVGRRNLCQFILETFSVPFEEVDKQWLTVPPKTAAKLVIHRTHRYRNDDAPRIYRKYIEQYKDSAVFIGFHEEWEDFCKNVCPIERYETPNFLELASIICGSEIFMGNQSAPMAIAIGLKARTIQEVSRHYPDCYFPHDNVSYIIPERVRKKPPFQVNKEDLLNT